MEWTEVPIPTPCGVIKVKVPVLGLPAIPFPPKLPELPKLPKLPLPDCSLLEHTGSAPDPPEDSEP